MSGGVDSAVAALLVRRTRRRRGDAGALARRGERRGGLLLLGRRRPARPVGRARDGHAALHARSAREFRAGVVEPFLAGYAAGETPNPCVGCNGHVRLDAMLDFADALGAPTLATGHYARVTDDGLLRVAADPAKDQTYMLAALSPASVARMRFPLAELTKPEVRALAAEADCRWPPRPDSQDLCFLAGTGKARFLARHGGLEDVPRRDRVVLGRGRRRARRLPPLHRRPAQGPRRRGRRAALRPAHRGGLEPRRRRLPRRAGRPPRARPRRPPAPPGRRGRRRPAALPLARGALPRRRRADAGTHRALELELDEPFYGAAPGQSACLLRGDVIVGWATIQHSDGTNASCSVTAGAARSWPAVQPEIVR